MPQALISEIDKHAEVVLRTILLKNGDLHSSNFKKADTYNPERKNCG